MTGKATKAEWAMEFCVMAIFLAVVFSIGRGTAPVVDHAAAPAQVVEDCTATAESSITATVDGDGHWHCVAGKCAEMTPVPVEGFHSSVLTPDIVTVGEFQRLERRVSSLERAAHEIPGHPARRHDT